MRTSSGADRAKPLGPQRPIQRRWIGSGVLLALIGVLSILTTYALVKANIPVEELKPKWLWRWTLLDLENSITLLVALITLWIMRAQFALGLQPHLVYDSHAVAESQLGLRATSTEHGFWSVGLKNQGPGLAIIQRMEFLFKADDRADLKPVDFDQLLATLRSVGLVPGRDIALATLSEGSVLAAGERVAVFELPLEHASRIIRLDITLRIASVLGDRFVKPIACIPRRGIQSSVEIPKRIVVPEKI